MQFFKFTRYIRIGHLSTTAPEQIENPHLYIDPGIGHVLVERRYDQAWSQEESEYKTVGMFTAIVMADDFVVEVAEDVEYVLEIFSQDPLTRSKPAVTLGS